MPLAADPIFEVRKDPFAERTFGIDYAARGFLEVGETIVSSTWIVPTGITISEEAQNATQTGAKFSGGTHGKDYVVKNRIVTTKGKDARSFKIKVKNR